jgi:hypothetical protein
LELQQYYARLVTEYESMYRTARSQLDHVEALLSSYSNSGNNLASTDQKQVQVLSVPQELLSLMPSEDADSPDVDFESDNVAADTILVSTPNQPSSQDTQVASIEDDDELAKVVEIPLLPQYGKLTRIEAIEKLLQERSGTVCHIDFIVRSLYGDLEPNLLKTVKRRVHSSLTHGVSKNFWAAIADEPGCYTLDLNLVTSKNDAKSKAAKNKHKKPPFILPKIKRVPMVGEFEGKVVIEAITIVLQRNSGKVFSVAEILSQLYGDLDNDIVREVKSAVLKELSRGYRTGKFSRVPNKAGHYTWDLKLVPKASLK